MLAEKDPLAMRRYEQCDGIPMPSLHVDDVSVKSSQELLDSETERQKQLPAPVGDVDMQQVHRGDHAPHDMSKMQ